MARRGIMLGALLAAACLGGSAESTAADDLRLQIACVGGDLDLLGTANTSVYTAYFHVPIADEGQVPVLLEVTGEDLVDYRLLRTTGPNILAAARMRAAPSTTLSWRAWVLIDAQDYEDVPPQIPIPALEDLPDSTRPFLQATATAQVDCSPIQLRAEALSGYQHVDSAADAVCHFVHGIPGIGDHRPLSFDAYYAMVWGSSCTGHAHAATALLRALGIPARTKLCFLTWYASPLDMHWTTDYFVPGYGWVGMDPSMGENPLRAQREVVVYCCDPADEFPLFYDHGIDCHWHTSDLLMGGRNPVWGLAHQLVGNTYLYTDSDVRDDLIAAAREAFEYEIDTRGVALSLTEMGHVAAARFHRETARDRLISGNVSGGLDELGLALDEYHGLPERGLITRFFTDFEDGAPGWTHGGVNDEWELGTPAAPGPDAALSGSACWGTDLDGNYENWTSAWLLSPPVDLSGLLTAQLELRLWNQTTGVIYDSSLDRFGVEIVFEDDEFETLTGPVLGGNDDTAIPVVGGWSQLDLDLTPYVEQTVRIRFRLFANGVYVRAGSYVDDVKITGVGEPASTVADRPPSAGAVLANLRVVPNPFNPRTRISFELDAPGRVRAALYDLAGRRVTELADRKFEAGAQALDWDGTDGAGRAASAGGYLLRIESEGQVFRRKLTLVR